MSKSAWDESVGVLVVKDGKIGVVEYSEITTEMAKRESNGKLVFGSANIGIKKLNFIFKLLIYSQPFLHSQRIDENL